jgi:hypothetical protein
MIASQRNEVSIWSNHTPDEGVPSWAVQGWRSLLKWEWVPPLAVPLGGVMLQSINVLVLTSVLPSMPIFL